MAILWIILFLMVLLAVGIFWFSLRSTKKNTAPSRDALNKQLYKQRLLEIDEDAKQGVLVQDPELINELKLTLLDELPEDNKQKSSTSRTLFWLPGIVILLAIASLYFYLGNYKQVERWQYVMQRMPQLTETIMVGRGQGATDQDLEDFILGVRTRLLQNPSVVKDWELLGRIGMATRNVQMAQQSYERALALEPNNPELEMALAKVLVQLGDPSSVEQADKLMASVLTSNPNDLEALSIAAFTALQQENFVESIRIWQLMKLQLKAGSERMLTIDRGIEYAQAQIAKKNTVGQSADNSSVVQDENSNVEGEYKVALSLANNVSANSGATLFLYAKAVNGSPMPLAVKRMPLPVFPITISLSDSDSMTAASKLSDVEEFYIGARIDSDGNINTKGGWQGRTPPIKKGSRDPIDLLIDQAL